MRKRSGGAKGKDSDVRQNPGAARELPADDEEQAFVRALIESGEAAELDSEGKLPPGATHELVKREGESPKVIRRRFSIT